MKIFIEIPTWLGDAVMATPAIENIVDNYPECELTIFGSFVSTKLFLNHPNVKKIIIDNSKKEGNRYLNLYNYAKGAGEFNKAFSFRKNFTTKFLLFFLKTDKSYIYKRYDKGLKTHQVIRYNDFINKSLNINTSPGKLKIHLKEPETYNNLKSATSKSLGLNPGATYGSAKRWYPEEFAKCAIELSNEYEIKIFGGPGETDIANDIEKSLKNSGVTNYTNLAGKTSIEELIENISSLDLFITNDSGPMHLAAAFNIPTAAIFGPTRHVETHQWENDKEMLIRRDMDCAPCMKRTCPLKHHNCMKTVTAKDVIERLKKENIIL